jgi:hypothetical protein
VSAEAAIPLVGTRLTPLVRHIDGNVLVAVQRGVPEILYCGFVPHESNLLFHFNTNGPLLLLRWLDAVQRREPPVAPPLVAAGEHVTLRLPGPATLRPVESWSDCYTVAGYEVTPGPDGTAAWQAPCQPGRWEVAVPGQNPTTFEVVWSDPNEQRLPFTRQEPLDLAILEPPGRTKDWRDLLPGLLLWVALGLLVLEWLLWLVGLVD